jgi:predicted NUDIX family NTP pyrophosphohydrolase
MTTTRAKRSAGLLLWRRAEDGALEVLIGHPGGPFYARKDEGAWSVLKGEIERDEDPLAVARREFEEETGATAPEATPIELGEIRLASGKFVVAWAFEGDLDPSTAESNTFELEWPPMSGRVRSFPEIDRVAWFDLTTARTKLNPAQTAFIDRLEVALG